MLTQQFMRYVGSAERAKEVKLIVTSKTDYLGVNFWPLCHVLALRFPKTREELDQLCGRSNRTDPNGVRHLTLPLSEGRIIDTFETLESTLTH